VFLKGVHRVPCQLRFLRNEIAVGELSPEFAPTVLFHEELDDDWLVVGYDYITGRYPTIAPGSPDLELVAATVDAIGQLPARDLSALGERWAKAGSWQEVAERAPELIKGWDVDEMCRWSSLLPEWLEGDRLVHTDLNAGHFIVSDSGRMYVIDWGWASVGAPWVDTSLTVLRLIRAGHSAESAEQWARARPAWTGLDEKTITAFAVFTAGFWTYRAVASGIPGWAGMSRMARDYATWRLERTTGSDRP
jgi:aminoglycoside phosphotransferase (APT) family kinase protein